MRNQRKSRMPWLSPDLLRSTSPCSKAGRLFSSDDRRRQRLSNKTNVSLMMPLQKKKKARLFKRTAGLAVEWITVIAALFLSAQLDCIYSIKAWKHVPLPQWALLTTDGKMLPFLGLLWEVLEGVSNKMTEWWKTKHKKRGGISFFVDRCDRSCN